MAFNDYKYLKDRILSLTGVDLNSYKEAQMKRRIDQLINKKGISDYPGYIELLKQDKDAMEEFLNHFTINVSNFYRNPEQWEYLEKEIIPKLSGHTKIRIWSAACSTGDEPYSLVMALSRHMPLSSIRITATDLDRTVIEKAKVGLYDSKAVANVPEDLKKKYFTQVGPSFQISDEIKSHVEFHEHNLLKDVYQKNYDFMGGAEAGEVASSMAVR